MSGKPIERAPVSIFCNCILHMSYLSMIAAKFFFFDTIDFLNSKLVKNILYCLIHYKQSKSYKKLLILDLLIDN